MTVSRFFDSPRIRLTVRCSRALSIAALIGLALTGSVRAQIGEDENGESTADTTQVRQATVAVEDWSTGRVRIEARFRAKGPVNWKMPPGNRPEGSLPEIQSPEFGILIRGPFSAIASAISAGTRSLWVEAGGTPCRIDLPAVELHEYHHSDEEGSDDLHCSWTVRNLLPGFSLWLARQGESELEPQPGSLLPTRNSKLGLVRPDFFT